MTVAKKAWAMLDADSPALPRHPYIARKRIQVDGLLHDGVGRILVPLRDLAGAVWIVQTINGNGEKFYLVGPKYGLRYMLDQPINGKPPALVGGVATGASVHEIT